MSTGYWGENVRWVVKMGEVLLKSRPVRRFMTKALRKHLIAQAEVRGAKISVTNYQGMFFVDLEDGEIEVVEDALRHTFGIIFAEPMNRYPIDLKAVAAAAIGDAPTEAGATFAVRCKRHGERQEWNSQTFAAALGAEILALAPHLKVNLGKPEWEVRVALFPDEVALLGERVVCPGGLPTGVQGLVSADLVTERDYLAAWLVMRRGCRLKPGEDADPRLIAKIGAWDPSHLDAQWAGKLATAPGPGHIGKIWGRVAADLFRSQAESSQNDKERIGSEQPETEGMAHLEPLVGWSQEELAKLAIRANG